MVFGFLSFDFADVFGGDVEAGVVGHVDGVRGSRCDVCLRFVRVVMKAV